MPLTGILIPGEAVSYKQKRRELGGEAVVWYSQAFGELLGTHK